MFLVTLVRIKISTKSTPVHRKQRSVLWRSHTLGPSLDVFSAFLLSSGCQSPSTPALGFLPTGWQLKPRGRAHFPSLILYDVSRLSPLKLHIYSYSNERRFLSRPGKEKTSISLYFMCNKGRYFLQCLWAKASGPWNGAWRSLLIVDLYWSFSGCKYI